MSFNIIENINMVKRALQINDWERNKPNFETTLYVWFHFLSALNLTSMLLLHETELYIRRCKNEYV